MRRSPAWISAVVLLFVGLALIVWRLAWVSDDACITLRTVDNWLAGHGLVWNVGERVQTYTHPLWMLLLAGVASVTGEFYYGTLLLGGLLSLGAAALLMRLGGHAAAAAATVALLIASRGFTDYSTSGLENPLTFVLLALLVTVSAGEQRPDRRLSRVAWLTGLCMCTRMDLAALCAPALLTALLAARRELPLPAVLGRAALGLSPFLAWSLFATIYYGTPFPITAYAKAFHTGVPAFDLLTQGLWYIAYVATHDTATLVTILGGIGVGLWRRELRCAPLAIGALLYCGYIVKVGGDFMSSRFATVPFVVAVGILARWFATSSPRLLLAPIAGAAALTILPGLPLWLQAPATDQPPTDAYHGVLDERRFYYYQLGLLSPTFEPLRPGVLSEELRTALGRNRPVVKPWGQVGRYGLQAGDLVHLVDPWLCDPLLMRLPVGHGKWRIGHFIRDIPTGYFETLAHGTNELHHPGLRRYYDTLRTILRAPVFAGERWAALWRMWTGQLDADRQDFVDTEYRTPPRIEVAAGDLRDPIPPMTWWFDDRRAHLVYLGGLQVRFDGEQRAASLRIWLHGDMLYRLEFRRGDQALGEVEVRSAALDVQGFPDHELAIPEPCRGFDTIWIDVPKLASQDVAAVGGLVLGS